MSAGIFIVTMRAGALNLVGEAQGCSPHPTVQRTALAQQSHPAPKVNSAKAVNPLRREADVCLGSNVYMSSVFDL